MSDSENFVVRWSRLKRETSQEKKGADGSSPSPPNDEAAAGEAHARKGTLEQAQETPFDVTTLPTVESLTAGSDIRAFLQSGVPAELTKAALRKMWTVDPAIRDFIGIAENQWDFTDPTAMPGFGPLEASDDVGKLVAQAMGKLEEAAKFDPLPDSAPLETELVLSESSAPDQCAIAQPFGMPEQTESSASHDLPIPLQHKPVPIAVQHDDSPIKDRVAPNRRTHGRALPR